MFRMRGRFSDGFRFENCRSGCEVACICATSTLVRSHHASLIPYHDINVIQQKGRPPMEKHITSLGVSPHNPPHRRQNDPIKSLRIKTIMTGIRLEHVGEIVKPLQHVRLAVEVEILHAMMRRNVIRPRDFEHAPDLAVFGVVVEFLDRETRAGEEEGRDEIVPHGVADEVGELEVGDGTAAGHANERSARAVERLEDLAISALDPSAIWGVDPTVIWVSAKTLDDRVWGLGIDVNGGGEVARVAFEVKEGARQVECDFD